MATTKKKAPTRQEANTALDKARLSPIIQAQVAQGLYRMGLRSLDGLGATPVDAAASIARIISDPKMLDQVAKAAGFPAGTTHDQVLKEFAGLAGYRDVKTFTSTWVDPVIQSDAQRAISDRMAEGDAEKDRLSGNRTPEPTKADREWKDDKSDLRRTIEAQIEQANRAPRGRDMWQKAKGRLATPESDLQTDIHKAWAAHSGEPEMINPSSRGAKAWEKRSRELGDDAESATLMKAVRFDVLERQGQERQFNETLQDTVEDATSVAREVLTELEQTNHG
jgi:hypothetical protein